MLFEKSKPEYKSGNQELYEKLKQIFNVQE